MDQLNHINVRPFMSSNTCVSIFQPLNKKHQVKHIFYWKNKNNFSCGLIILLPEVPSPQPILTEFFTIS